MENANCELCKYAPVDFLHSKAEEHKGLSIYNLFPQLFLQIQINELITKYISILALPVMEFQDKGYKIRKIFA